jgi:hypothetical protein
VILLIGLVVIVCAGLLVLGFLAPRLSRRVQKRLDRGAQRAKSAARSQPKPARKAGERSAELTQRAFDRTSEVGRHEREEAEQARR